MYEEAEKVIDKLRGDLQDVPLTDWVDFLESLRDLVATELSAARDDLNRGTGE